MLAVLPASAAANPPTQIIVKREAGLSAAERRDIRADAGVRFLESLPLPRTEVVAVAPGELQAALRALNADPDVVYAERDRAVSALAPDQCSPYSVGGSEPCLWGTAKIFQQDPDAAWALSMGTGRTVAVVDSGVDAAHPDLLGRVAAGYDWVEDDTDAQDQHGHGTHVAGTIAATRENGTGIVGVAPMSRIVPLRVLDGSGNGYVSDVIAAFDWAGSKGIRVVNASLGAQGFLQAEYESIARHPNTLYVVAAGNDGADNDVPAEATYPCAYDLPNILCVGATDAADERASFSNHGAASVDIYAPGVDIVSTMLGTLYRNDGTSMATPHVAATAALLVARNPSLTMTQLKDAILQAALSAGTIKRLDASASLALVTEDSDGDGVADAQPDNCVDVWNPDQVDADGDGIGDACDEGASFIDRDEDGVADSADACPDETWVGGDAGCPFPATTAPDRDHDGVPDATDPCPDTTVPGGFGCPDADRDRVANSSDNCPTTYNPGQEDADGDGIGDACDPTPRGDDADGDGVPRLDDACPNVYGTLPNGCPPPPPPPSPPADTDRDGRPDTADGCPLEYANSLDGCPLAQVAALSAKARKRRTKRSATVTVVSTRAATMRITVERRKGRRWVRVTRRTVAGTQARLRLSRLKRGSYRVRVSISSSAGRGTAVSKRFRVR